MDIEALLNSIEQFTDSMFEEEYKRYEKFQKLLPGIQRYITELIQLMAGLGAEGRNNIEKLMQQMRNLSEAIEKKDTVLLFDTVYYEIKDSLYLYQEILKDMER
jgi:hypothetical protein